MNAGEKYIQMMKKISKAEKTNEDIHKIVTARVRLLNVIEFRFFGSCERNHFYIIADTVDRNPGIQETLILTYEPVNGMDSEIIANMIFSFLFNSPRNYFLEFITEGRPDSDMVEIKNTILVTD